MQPIKANKTEAFAKQKFWLLSDTHFFHERIAQYANRPADWQQTMLRNWHQQVQKNDVILHLGDLSFGKPQEICDVLFKLPGCKYLIKGNHDKQNQAFYQSCGFQVITPFHMPVEYNGKTYKVIFCHRPGNNREDALALVNYPQTINVHGHIHQGLIPHPAMLNACVEHTQYRPVWFADWFAQQMQNKSHEQDVLDN